MSSEAEEVIPTSDSAEQPAAVAEKSAKTERQKADKPAEKAAVKHYVTTDKVRSASGRLRDPLTGLVFSRERPLPAEFSKGGWLDSQIQAGLIQEYKI